MVAWYHRLVFEGECIDGDIDADVRSRKIELFKLIMGIQCMLIDLKSLNGKLRA